MPSLKQVDVKTAHQLRASGECTYVDVRSVPEFDRGHPEGAQNVPLLHAEPSTRLMRPNPEFLAVMQANYAPDTRLLLGCQMGGRSAQAGQILLAAGYQDVSNVIGGFGGARDRATGQLINEGWVDAALPVEQEAPETATYDYLRGRVADPIP